MRHPRRSGLRRRRHAQDQPIQRLGSHYPIILDMRARPRHERNQVLVALRPISANIGPTDLVLTKCHVGTGQRHVPRDQKALAADVGMGIGVHRSRRIIHHDQRIRRDHGHCGHELAVMVNRRWQRVGRFVIK